MPKPHFVQRIILQIPHQRIKLGHAVGDRRTRCKGYAAVSGKLVHVAAFCVHIGAFLRFGLRYTGNIPHFCVKEQIFVSVALIHKQSVRAELFKGDNIILFALIVQPLKPCIQRFPRFLKLLDGVVFRIGVLCFLYLEHQLVDLLLEHHSLPFHRQRNAFKLAVTDDDRIVIARRNSRAEFLSVGRLKVLFGCDKDIRAGIELQKVAAPLLGQMVRHDKQRLAAQSQTLAFHSSRNHFKRLPCTYAVRQERIAAVKHMSDRVFLMRAEGDCRIHPLKGDMTAVVFAGTVAVEARIVFLHQIRTAGRVTENPVLKRRLDRVLLLLGKHGFLFVQYALFLAVLRDFIEDSRVTEIQSVLQQLITVYTVCAVGHAHTDISVAVAAFAADIPFTRRRRIADIDHIPQQIPRGLEQLRHKITDVFRLDPCCAQTHLNVRRFQILRLDLLKKCHIDRVFRIVFRKRSCNLQFPSHIARKVFVAGFPFVVQGIHKDHPAKLLGQLRLGFARKLHHIGKINFRLFAHRYRQCFTCRINARYNLRFLDGAFGKHIRFSLQIALMVNDLQRAQQAIAVVGAERPFIGAAAEQAVLFGVIVIEPVQLRLSFRNFGVASVV